MSFWFSSVWCNVDEWRDFDAILHRKIVQCKSDQTFSDGSLDFPIVWLIQKVEFLYCPTPDINFLWFDRNQSIGQYANISIIESGLLAEMDYRRSVYRNGDSSRTCVYHFQSQLDSNVCLFNFITLLNHLINIDSIFTIDGLTGYYNFQ